MNHIYFSVNSFPCSSIVQYIFYFGFKKPCSRKSAEIKQFASPFLLAQAFLVSTIESSYFFFPQSAMSKQDLIAAIADAAGITKRAGSDALEALISIVTKELKKGHNVTITGFGTFRVSKRQARTGVNPRNPSQKISIPAMKVPSFKAGKTLKDAVR
jgi:DNA-binding protein HU-beta